MPSNWGYILFAYLCSWGVLLTYMFWLWNAYRRLNEQHPAKERSANDGER